MQKAKKEEKLSKVEMRNLCPMIAMISAGKTSILRLIYNIDFLEVSAGIGTKFVNFIRYNPEVGNNPKFYHLIVKKTGYGKYEYYKDPNFPEIVGAENIKQKNKEINNKYKDDQKNIPYEELFYMVEVGNSNLIEDKEYLKNYDLVDVPGVSEYRGNENDKEEAPAAGKPKKEEKKNIYDSVEKTMMNYDPKSEKNYLTEIFKIMKDNINNGIIVFSVDNFEHVENYEIIGKLQKILNKPLENYLVLLNKMDNSDNIERDISVLQGKLFKYFPSAKVFNFTKNIIVPCSALQLENESKLENEFKYFLYYHFLNFTMNSKKNTSGETPTTDGFSFIDFLKKINPIKNLTKKEYDEIINKILEDKNLDKILTEIKSIIDFFAEKNKDNNSLTIGVRPDEFVEEEILKIKENSDDDDEEEQEEKEEGKKIFNLNEQDERCIILYYYSLFKSKNKDIFPEKSEEYIKIANYFTIKNMKNQKDEIVKIPGEDYQQFLEKERRKQNKIDEISIRMNKFYNEISKESIRPINIDNLNTYINSSINILKASRYFYIPFIGVSNAGKSTILNDLIGFILLPAHKSECTKKGVLIKHWNRPYPALRKTHFKPAKTLNNEIYYYFEPESREITIGVNNIQRVLEASNYEFSHDNEDFFLEIDVNIRFINEMNLDNDLKEKICFIDLPGFGTNNEFENQGIYQSLINSCNLFIFVVFNLKIKENKNEEMLKKLFHIMSDKRGITSKGFLKKCLFIVNSDQNQEISEITLNQAKSDILEITTHKKDNDFKDINVSFFNAKIYEKYLVKLMYYQSAGNLIQNEYIEYKKSKSKFFRGLIDYIAGGSFYKYLLKKLKDNIKEDIKEKSFNKQEVDSNEDIEKSIRNALDYNFIKFGEKEITLISKYIIFGSKNIVKSNLKSDSKYEFFKGTLHACIKEAKDKEDKEINENLINCFKIFDNVFEVDPNTKFGKCRDAPTAKVVKAHMEKDLQNMKSEIEKYLNLINKEFIDNDVSKVLNEGSKKISDALVKEKSDISLNLANKSWENVQKQIQEVFGKVTRELKTNLLKTLKTATEKIKKYYDKCYNKLDEFYLKPCERKNQLYENYVSNSLGGSNKIETTIEDLISDIIKASNTATDWDKNSVFGWLKAKLFDADYLNRVIDSIISSCLPKIKSFCDSITGYSSSYKKLINDEIVASKNRVELEMEERKKKEQIEINLANSKNEEEKNKWLEEKRIYEEKVKAWEAKCRQYRILRDEITEIRFTTS